MQNQLNERHKECLRELVKLVREGTIPDEFMVLKRARRRLIITTDNQRVEVAGVSPLGLEALTRAGYIFSLARYERKSSSFGSSITEYEFESSRSCYITPEGLRAVDSGFAPFEDIMQRRPPIEITASLAAFKRDFPDSTRLAFVMMQFGETKAHKEIQAGIRKALDPLQFITLRADDKVYHDDLFFNILTYVYGCRFGIAVFERIETEEFNPNVALEVGYMLGLEKPVCYLKDRTLKTLHTDLAGKMYRKFDPQCCDDTIPDALWKWMEDKGIMSKRVEMEGVQGPEE
ncbi:MAG: hypothetical protein J7M40_01370 [Planctomycetes bacterium]|nr:hypothetical protein [Planctomycetota bacterium]